MSKIIQIRRADEDRYFYVYWTLTDFCNFACNYCPGILHSGDFAQGRKPGFPSDEEIQVFLDRLVADLRGRKLYMVLSGGEPTLHPMYSRIIEQLSPYGVVCTNTNGSRSADWWANLPVLPKQATISLHPEFSKMDKINETARYLVKQGVDLRFNLSCDPSHWADTVALYEAVADDLKIYIQPKVLNHLESTRDNYDYTEEQLAWMKECQQFFNANKHRYATIVNSLPFAYYDDGTIKQLANLAELTMSKQHAFEGWSCYAGYNTLNVHFDGNVWAAICKIQNLGRITNFELLDKPVTCTKKFCTCPGDILIAKKSPLSTN